MPVDTSSDFNPVRMKLSVDMPNFPEWAIPFVKIIPKAYLDDGVDVENFTGSELTLYCHHFWQYIADNHWKIIVELEAVARDNVGDLLSVYTDVDLVILNEHAWEELNPNKN